MADRKFVPITREEFEATILYRSNGTPSDFAETDICGCAESVYILRVLDRYEIRVYSTIPKGCVTARDVGKDAIRIAVIDTLTDTGTRVVRRINRTKNWRARLRDRVNEAFVSIRRGEGMCPTCGAVIRRCVVRKEGPNKGKVFYRCQNESCNYRDFPKEDWT